MWNSTTVVLDIGLVLYIFLLKRTRNKSLGPPDPLLHKLALCAGVACNSRFERMIIFFWIHASRVVAYLNNTVKLKKTYETIFDTAIEQVFLLDMFFQLFFFQKKSQYVD